MPVAASHGAAGQVALTLWVARSITFTELRSSMLT